VSTKSGTLHCCCTWEAAGFAGAPRALGYDDQGAPGAELPRGHRPAQPFNLSDAPLLSASELVLAFHDATATSPLCDGQEVVCHGDLGPHNTVFREQSAVGIIDWDSDVRRADGPTTSRTQSGVSLT